MFPTLLRSTAQGVDVRGCPDQPRHLELLRAASALLGLFFAPSNAGKSLDGIQEEQTGSAAPATGRFDRGAAVPNDAGDVATRP